MIDRARLTRDYIRDLVVDIRCARRDGLPEYAAECIERLRLLWKARHVAKIGRFGVPEVPKT